MRQKLLQERLWFLAGIVLLASWQLQADKVWIDNPSITEPSAFAPVVDENLYIAGVNRLVDHIHIAAISQDVLVTVSVAEAVVTTSDFNAPGVLHIFADAGRTVTFDVKEDLTFRGSSRDLLITYSGAGSLIFNVAGSIHLSFTSLEQEQGAKFLVNVDSFARVSGFNTLFTRFPVGDLPPSNQDLNAFVNVGAKSLFGFIAPAGSAGNSATIAFDPSNTYDHLGRLILQVQNGGSIDIRVSPNSAGTGNGFGDITLSDINLASTGGITSTGNFEIINANGDWAGLLVVNSNTQWAQLQSNPWCEAVVSTTPVGFVLGQNGTLTTNDNTYLDYVGTVTNYSYSPTVLPSVLEEQNLEGIPAFTYVKDRNPSAFIVDGSSDPFASPRAEIIMEGKSAIYFRSGVDRDGVTTFSVFDPALGDFVISFTIPPDEAEHGLAGYGEIVFDVEGPVDITGAQPVGENVLNILSLYVSPTGGSVFIESPEVSFPLRTYARDANGDYLQYNKACFMINNRATFINASLQHTDNLHLIFDKNFPDQSEASYIGGESWKLCEDRPRPNFVLNNSQVLLHTSAAATGVDFLTPQVTLGNNSYLKFYYNGRCVDQGTGRELVLGTNIGALASDLNTVINRDAHLDIYQEQAQASPQAQVLNLIVAPNNNKVVEGLPANGNEILNEFSIQTIFLGWGSNISIGTNASVGTDPVTSLTFLLTTTPELYINGDFFSFETQGGETNQPEMSMTTGQGGIFVDKNGVIEIEANKRANVGTMITKSRNASIDLPKRQVFFDLRIGIAQWRLDLGDPDQREIVAEGQSLSDYTLDWANITKDYCATPTTSGFVPYEPVNTPAACQCLAITNQNLTGIPVVRGIVDQFQVKNSRLGDQVHLLVDGGIIRELIMLTGNTSADAPVGVIVLENDAQLGLGTAHRNVDSDDGQVVLGLNGIILVPNGNAQVILNEDVLINNVCPILTGTLFGDVVRDQLLITSVVPREIRVKNEGVLDLSAFMTENQELVIGGDVTLVFEPGSQLIMGGGRLRISENAKVIFQPYFNEGQPAGTTLTSTNPFRVRWTGSGNFIMSENAKMIIERGAYVGIESAGYITESDTIGVDQTDDVVVNCSYITSQTWTIRDSAQILIGSETEFGGSLQVGNTMDLTGSGARIDWQLELNGIGATIDTNSQGLLGLGVGVVDKPEDVPNTWLVDRTFNVENITIKLTQGTLRASQIYSGDNKLAGLIAFGRVGSFNFTFDNLNVDILGGGNMILLNQDGPIVPTVLNTKTTTVGILSSTEMLTDLSKIGLFVNPFTPATLFNYLAVNEYNDQSTKLATIAQNTLGSPSAGYIDQGLIVRDSEFRIQGLNTVVDPSRSVEQGVVGMALDNATRVATYSEVVM